MSEADIACLISGEQSNYRRLYHMKKTSILIALASLVSIIASAGAMFSWR